MHRTSALVGLLGIAMACLNPDISDEPPLSVQADALEDDAALELDEAEDDAELDETEDVEGDDPVPTAVPDSSAPDADGRGRPRRTGARR